VGKLKNLRIGSDDIAAQKQEPRYAGRRGCHARNSITELGTVAAYLSQAEMVLMQDHAWVKQAQDVRKQLLEKLASDRTAQHAAEYRQTLAQA
jgi:hypothetical protein